MPNFLVFLSVSAAFLAASGGLAPEEFESSKLHREKVVPGGKEITIIIGPLKPGRYEFVGDFNRATAHGAIIVK
jgi:hypothetical protein